jgi:hypothetical protein
MMDEYEAYFDECERCNRVPLNYEEWLKLTSPETDHSSPPSVHL